MVDGLALQKAIGFARHFCGKSKAYPELESIVLQVKAGKLSVRATNIEAHMMIGLPVRDAEEFECAVYCRALKEALTRLLNGGKQGTHLTIRWDGNNLFLVRENRVVPFLKSDLCRADCAPPMPEEHVQAIAEIDPRDFCDALKRLGALVPKDTSVPQFAAIAVLPTGSAVRLGTTDGYRMGIVEVRGRAQSGSPVLLPRSVLKLPGPQRLVFIHAGKEYVRLQYRATIGASDAQVVAVFRTPACELVDYERVMAQSPAGTYVVLAPAALAELHAAIDDLRYPYGDYDRIDIEVNSAWVVVRGRGLERSVVAAVTGPGTQVSVNADYLQSVLRAAEDPQGVELRLAGPGYPVWAVSSAVKALVMPLGPGY